MTTAVARASSAGAHPRERTHLRVVGRRPVADGVVEVVLAHPDGERLPDWAPGAHVDLVLPDGAVRQYSLCGDRWDPSTYRVAVLREDVVAGGRGGSVAVHDDVAVGDLLPVGGPRNHFPMVPAEEYLFVAGGIGITPLLPMLDQAQRVGAAWRLLHLGRRRATMAYAEELARYGEHVEVAPRQERGRTDVAAWLGGPGDHAPRTRVYCCGPEPLLTAVRRACAAWPPHVLRTESFAAAELAEPVRRDGFEVELARSGTSVQVTSGTSVLDALAAAGAVALSSCRSGTCGTCEVTVLAGTVDHRDSILSDAERARMDCMYPCVSRATSDRLVVDL